MAETHPGIRHPLLRLPIVLEKGTPGESGRPSIANRTTGHVGLEGSFGEIYLIAFQGEFGKEIIPGPPGSSGGQGRARSAPKCAMS
jgi:hypothetical protein